MKFMDMFDSSEEYPSAKLDSLLPWNTCWDYVSSTFLDGLINYCKIKKAFVVNRYHDWSEVIDEETNETKHERFVKLTTSDNFHSKLDTAFQDDVLLLAKIERHDYSSTIPEGREGWIFFWYDRDCSDCCVGRFHTDKADATVIELFTEFCEEETLRMSPVEGGRPREIPLTYFRGWLSSK